MNREIDPVTLALSQVAEKNHTTVEEVRREIALAIQLAMENPSPETKTIWQELPHTGDAPAPEEVIAYAVRRIHHSD